MEHLGGHAPFLERAGAEVLDEDVGLRDEIAGDLLAFGHAQVEGDGSLVSGNDAPPGGLGALPPMAHRIALAGLFDLDDVGAHVAHELAAERASDERAHLDDADAF